MRNLATLLIILVATAILLRQDFVFYIIYVIVGLWLLARFGLRWSIQNIHWQRQLVHRAFIGDSVGVEVRLHNRSVLPLPWLRITDAVPAQLYGREQARQITSLAPRGRFQFEYQLECSRRGLYTIGPLIISGGDPIGFFEHTFRPDSQDHLIVYPQIYTLTSLHLDSKQPFGTIASRQRLFEDPARVAGVRTYQTGDSVRYIHWRASAHADELLVKKLDPAIALESMILLNLHRPDYQRRLWQGVSEWSISLAASLSYHLIQAGQAVGLAVDGVDPLATSLSPPRLPPQTGQAHLMQMLDVLARIDSEECDPFITWLTHATLDLSWGTTLLVISPQADDALTSALHQQVRRGLNILLIVTEPYGQFARVASRARQLGMRAVNLTREGELKQWAQGTTPVRQLK